MMKKIVLPILLLLVMITLTACQPKSYTVTFDSQGGSDVAALEVTENEAVTAPTAPMRDAASDGSPYSFVTWATDMDGNSPYDFTAPVTGDITLYAIWSKDVVLSFDTKTSGSVDSVVLGADGGTVSSAPTPPAREGYTFGGWFKGRAGLTWLEPQPVTFPMDVTSNTVLYAYWEPVDSKAIQYSNDETYFSSIDSSSSLILNPMQYQWSHEDTFINWMATPLYTSAHIDWDKAIADGVADYVGDFSKIKSQEFSVDALDYKTELLGATHFPMDKDGDEHLTENGDYDRDNASSYQSTEWTFNLRDDMYFENGVNVTADTYEYTLKMFLDPTLNNYRANIYFKTEDNKNGYPILNAYEYYTGTTTWDNVGFEKVDMYSFTITFSEPVSQSMAVALGNIRLVEPTAFALSLTADGTNSTYGTPGHPYVSYGEYILKSWDENQKLVFNKNFDYLGKEDILYKSRVIQVVDDVDQRMALFAQGDLSVAGLNQDYYEQYAEANNVYKAWDGYPQYLLVNLADSQLTEGGYVHPSIMFDQRFRQALFYGFDRKYYATSVYAPNTASLLPVPLDTKAFNQDPLYFSQSPQHLAVLEKYGIDPATEGYIPDKAVSLFNEAYAAWQAEDPTNNTGPVSIKLISDNDEFSKGLVEYIKGMYEDLFGTDKILINVVYSEPTANRQAIANWDFDLSLNSIGFGSSTGIQWQYPAIAFYGSWIGGGSLGLSQPNDASTDSGVGGYDSEAVTIDLTNTYNYLSELGEDYLTEQGLTGQLALLDDLKEVTDENGNVTKEAGIFEGTIYDISDYTIEFSNSDSPWDVDASEPYPGAANDIWNIVAAMEDAYFQYLPQIPTVTRSSATIYADNIEIWWPAYSVYFGWGTESYRFITTDPDMADGLFNSFAPES